MLFGFFCKLHIIVLLLQTKLERIHNSVGVKLLLYTFKYLHCGAVLLFHQSAKLNANTVVDASTGNQVNKAYAWGYADNQGSDSEAGTSGEAVKNYFKISEAVTADGEAAALQYIDFVKVQSGINHTAGALGEISTEVLAIEDENM